MKPVHFVIILPPSFDFVFNLLGYLGTHSLSHLMIPGLLVSLNFATILSQSRNYVSWADEAKVPEMPQCISWHVCWQCQLHFSKKHTVYRCGVSPGCKDSCRFIFLLITNVWVSTLKCITTPISIPLGRENWQTHGKVIDTLKKSSCSEKPEQTMCIDS